jgi:hypothetical protein
MVHTFFFFGLGVIGENRGERRDLMGGRKRLIRLRMRRSVKR